MPPGRKLNFVRRRAMPTTGAVSRGAAPVARGRGLLELHRERNSVFHPGVHVRLGVVAMILVLVEELQEGLAALAPVGLRRDHFEEFVAKLGHVGFLGDALELGDARLVADLATEVAADVGELLQSLSRGSRGVGVKGVGVKGPPCPGAHLQTCWRSRQDMRTQRHAGTPELT